jgi:hypothetical protein
MDGRKIRGLRADDINGRLAVAGVAFGIIRLEVPPVVRAVGTAVTPMWRIRGMRLGGRGVRENQDGAKDEERCCSAGQTIGHGNPPWRRRKNSISLCERIFKYSVWKTGNVRVYSQWPNGKEDANGRGAFRSARA